MGWDAFENLDKQNVEIINKFDQLAWSVFTTPQGKELLTLLTDQFLHASVANPNDSAAIAYWREGQNSLIRRILNVINKKQQQTPPITETINVKSKKSEEIKT